MRPTNKFAVAKITILRRLDKQITLHWRILKTYRDAVCRLRYVVCSATLRFFDNVAPWEDYVTSNWI